MVGSTGKILATEDEGESWQVQQSVTSNDLKSVCFDPSGTAWIVGRNGTILKFIHNTVTSVDDTKETKTEPPQDFIHVQNYPNPFNPETQIRFQLPIRSQVNIRIFNTLGQQIRTLVNREYEPGSHLIQWDGKNDNGSPAASGMYFYRFQAGDFSRVMSMSLVR